MDVNTALRNLLLACHPSAATDDDARSDALDALDAIGGWLKRGGFMPDGQTVIAKLISEGYYS